MSETDDEPNEAVLEKLFDEMLRPEWEDLIGDGPDNFTYYPSHCMEEILFFVKENKELVWSLMLAMGRSYNRGRTDQERKFKKIEKDVEKGLELIAKSEAEDVIAKIRERRAEQE